MPHIAGSGCLWDIFLQKKGWKVYDLEIGEVFVSRDVVFQEEHFPFANSKELNSYVNQGHTLPNGVYDDEYDEPGQKSIQH